MEAILKTSRFTYFRGFKAEIYESNLFNVMTLNVRTYMRILVWIISCHLFCVPVMTLTRGWVYSIRNRVSNKQNGKQNLKSGQNTTFINGDNDRSKKKNNL